MENELHISIEQTNVSSNLHLGNKDRQSFYFIGK